MPYQGSPPLPVAPGRCRMAVTSTAPGLNAEKSRPLTFGCDADCRPTAVTHQKRRPGQSVTRLQRTGALPFSPFKNQREQEELEVINPPTSNISISLKNKNIFMQLGALKSNQAGSFAWNISNSGWENERERDGGERHQGGSEPVNRVLE